MPQPKKLLIERNIDRFISNTFDKRDRKKDNSTHFEWFANSMHIWYENSQSYNSNTKIGKDVNVGSSLGIDAFFITINNNEKLFTLNDDLVDVIEYIKVHAKSITFNFIQSKLTNSITWAQFLNLIDIPLRIWKGQNFDSSQGILIKIQDFIDEITNSEDEILGSLEHKVSVFFYTNKNATDIESLEKDWKTDIDQKKKELYDYFKSSNVKISFRGSDFLNDIYEKITSNEYKLLINKSEVIQAEEFRYLIGYITAKELLDAVAPKTSEGMRSLYPDVFKNNIRLYLGQNEINKKIESTLIEEPERFHYYNNGLTITTKEIKDENSRNYLVSPVNIVNGCQTTNSIYNVHNRDNFDEQKIKIPVRIIVAQDEEYENITVRTNTQNGIEAKDLVSISTMQKELQELFDSVNFENKRFTYKRQKGEVVASDADYIIQIDDLLRAVFATIMLIPDRVSGYFDKTTLRYIDRVFDERFVKLYMLVTAFYKLTEDYIDDKYPQYNRLKYHFNYLAYRIISKSVNYRFLEEYLKYGVENEEQEDIKLIEEMIQNIISNIYAVLKENNGYKLLINHIISVVEVDYSALTNIETKADEKILYKAVEKLKRIRTSPIFENFDDKFTLTINDIIQNGTRN